MTEIILFLPNCYIRSFDYWKTEIPTTVQYHYMIFKIWCKKKYIWVH